MKHYGRYLLLLSLFVPIDSLFSFVQVRRSKKSSTASVAYNPAQDIDQVQQEVDALSDKEGLSSSQVARLAALKKALMEYRGEEVEVPAAPSRKTQGDEPEAMQKEPENLDDEDVKPEPVQKEEPKKAVVPAEKPKPQAQQTKPKPVQPAEDQSDVEVDSSVDTSMIETYYEALVAYAIADKNNPLIISPFAGVADKQARKVFDQAKADLKLAKDAFNQWLAKTTPESPDFVSAKELVNGLINDMQPQFSQAKKDNPTVAVTDAQKKKRAAFEDIEREMKAAQSILKELNNKKK